MRVVLTIGFIISMLACYIGFIKCWLRIADIPEAIIKEITTNK